MVSPPELTDRPSRVILGDVPRVSFYERKDATTNPTGYTEAADHIERALAR